MEQHFHCGFFHVDAISDQFRSHLGGSKHGANHAAIAVGKRPHGVIDMHGMMCAVGDAGARLLVGRVRMANSDYHTGVSRRIDAGQGAEQFRCNRQYLSLPRGRLHEFVQQLGGREPQPLERMYASPDWTEEGSLKMNPEHLCPRVVGFVLLRNVARDAFDAAKRVLGTRRHRRRHE